MIKRFDRLDIIAADVGEAASVYRHNFGFVMERDNRSGDMTIRLGDAELRLQSAAVAAETLPSASEGLAAIWLETEDIDQVAETLTRAGIRLGPMRRDNARRIISVDPESANKVPVFIFQRD